MFDSRSGTNARDNGSTVTFNIPQGMDSVTEAQTAFIQLVDFQASNSFYNITNFNKLQKKNFNKKILSLSLKENVTAYFKIHPKNYLEFWWSENPINNYNLFQTDLSFINEFSFTQDGLKFSDFDKTNVNSVRVLNKMNFIIMWASLILFHVSLLFTLLNISQIRTFIKFQLLVLYKITNLYLTIIYSTFKIVEVFSLINILIFFFSLIY